jgi:NADPH-dependent 2,4-dienoyl-CoA reductase/sulfur reductase-like enzyme
MLPLKTVENAKVWLEKLSKADKVLVIGGDRTSFAFTKAILSVGKKVYFALTEDAFWPLRLNNTLLEEVARNLTEKGVEVLKHSRLKGVSRHPDGTIEAQVENRNIRVGLIGAFFGLIPDIRFVAQSGLRIDRGILVDEFLNTGFKDIFATGDCAQVYHPDIRDYWVSIGHDNAVDLGRIAAMNLAGGMVQAEVAKESIFELGGIKVNTSWWTDY